MRRRKKSKEGFLENLSEIIGHFWQFGVFVSILFIGITIWSYIELSSIFSRVEDQSATVQAVLEHYVFLKYLLPSLLSFITGYLITLTVSSYKNTKVKYYY